MSRYYKGKQAYQYNIRWQRFNTRTLSETLAMIDMTALHSIKERQGRMPRVLDVACGTGLLLKQLLAQVPGMEAYGLDASADMLAQAQATLKDQPHVHLERMQIGRGTASNFPYGQKNFDLITCTNALHDMPEAVAFLAGLGKLLAPGGQLVVEDFAPRQPRLIWAVFEWFLQQIKGNKVHAYTLKVALSLCEQAGLHVASEKRFIIDWLWHGWVLSV
ncbi:MAG TPA: class I SAM-dependent methyltransferase [Ktedonobacteraceae bacterium]|jgi:ubiquinone/menaquinone biosynthesis C-methylase UbiE|nr:class I SAM-dependent methyltransferase [Ktedonobacteraceae bacterium]